MENVEVFTSEGKGRGLKATKEFCAADVIFAERAYAAVVFDSLVNFVCHTCFKRQEKLHRCGQCKYAHYCDRTCQKGAWLDHKGECSAIRRYGKVPNENIRSVLDPCGGHGIPKCQAGDGGSDRSPRPKEARLSANQERDSERLDFPLRGGTLVLSTWDPQQDISAEITL
ncbi:hypothetical protein MC885_004925 [Smutsia gigantea]|nr:hypothetical protein MC885_004925 [Smutsia gigantea]